MSNLLGVQWTRPGATQPWELWPDRATNKHVEGVALVKHDGQWRLCRPEQPSVAIDRQVDRMYREVVTEIERRWPTRALVESASDETALAQTDEVLVGALKMAERRTAWVIHVAVAGWAVTIALVTALIFS